MPSSPAFATRPGPSGSASRAALLAAFAAVYVIWGSTYLAIRFAVETIPPLLMAGTRFALAGALVIAWMRLRHGVAAPTMRQWISATIIGGLLLLAGNGLICIAELRVPSGLTALLVATVPLWMTTLEWLLYRGRRPTPAMFLGLAIGLLGVLVLIDPRDILGQPIDLPSTILVLIACLSWTIGSLYSRRAPLPKSLMLTTGMEMLCGGALLMIAGSARGEWSHVDFAAISPRSAGAYVYLVVFGSLIGFSAYIWLLKHVSAAAVSTYAYVNPLVAVLLGWWLAHEPLGLRTIIAAGLIIAAVMLITMRRATAAPQAKILHQPTTPAARQSSEPELCGCAEDQ